MPQNKAQLYMAHSMIKHVHEDYVPGEEITITPLVNKNKLYAGMTKLELEKRTIWAPNSTTELQTDLTTRPRITIDSARLLSLYTTRPPVNNKPNIGIEKEITVTASGDVRIVPAA
jgi:hypothetical protein